LLRRVLYQEMAVHAAHRAGGRVKERGKEPGMVIVDLSRHTRLTASAIALCAAAALSAFAGVTSARAETAIRFTLDRKIDGAAAPFFVAIDRGYFKAEGLDVSIEPGNGEPFEPIKRLASGAYDMGVVDINPLIKYRDSTGASVRAVFVVFDKPPYAVVARKSRGIAAPKDLEGKKLAAPADDLSFTQWPIFASVNGIDTGKVAIESVGAPVREPMLAAGEVDAITGYPFTVYVDLKDRGVPPDDLAVLPMADYGLALYGDAIAVAPKFAADKPEAVQGFLRAYVRALKDTVHNPVHAIDAVLQRKDTAKRDVELERLRMAITDNILTPAVKASGFGAIEPERFAEAINQIGLAYKFKDRTKAAEAFDPSFLPATAERKVSESTAR
jgi:NitT/TauT family transport system substrate-binding protein